MLPKRRDEREREQERDRDAKDGGDHVPLARGRRIPDVPTAQALQPRDDRAQSADVQQGADPDHLRRDRAQSALTERERATRRTG